MIDIPPQHSPGLSSSPHRRMVVFAGHVVLASRHGTHALCQNTADQRNDLVLIIGSLPRSLRNVAAVPRRMHPHPDPSLTIVDAAPRRDILNIEDACWNRSHRIRAMRRLRQSENGDVRGTLTRAEMAVTTDIDSRMHGVRIGTMRSKIKAPSQERL
ncbi:hypothetical protein [Burkholderia sp. BCC1630]|uniref:hypothetical protein n=2 Tax=Burkholderia TaxID=32008 RepID=UPI00158B9247|nr:hypothetical protein [Burkholderia sp. BCC1630]